ncbi:MAG: hypothetical protein II744_02520 [Eubacterium sp.]|nr:hypothetical protein [Eubacterium sp.]MBR6392898.1 hypothetical protein [Eubacterium sp.]MBR7072175.1 hypothetical protein [Eubacterium sp.]
MTNEIIIGGMSLIGTVIGTFGGIMAANRLSNYRIEQLEKKVDKHNNLIDRMYKLEEKTGLLEQAQKVTDHRIDDLERGSL